jgi:phosphate transport system permease protein
VESDLAANVARSLDSTREGAGEIDLKKKPRTAEALIQGFLFFCGALSILTTIGIVTVLGRESLNFFSRRAWENTNKSLVLDVDEFQDTFAVSDSGQPVEAGAVIRLNREIMRVTEVSFLEFNVERGEEGTVAEVHSAGTELFAGDRVSLIEFFTGTKWNPQIHQFGIWPLLSSTLMTTAIAMLVALPLGLGAAIFLSEYASQRMRNVIKPILEVLAGIPTVVYGYFALTFMTPFLRQVFGNEVVQIYNTASAGLVMGILILPLVSSMSEDALSAVPRSLREAAYGLGATKLETALRVVVPAGISGITAAFIVGVSRAIGETMIVAIAAGAGPAFTFNPFRAAETMTGHIVRISGGDLSYDSIDYNSIFAIGLMLFLMTLSLNILSQRVVRRYREVYE